eukprot:m.35394 g.35394  ORF g.35394 m.35394 type:complete len:187 (+) comp32108_c0_seq2:37-597(+)
MAAVRNASIRASGMDLDFHYSSRSPTRVIKMGYLIKSPPVKEVGSWSVKRWRKRWCVLQRDFENKVSLFYYKNENSYLAKKPCRGVIAVDEAQACFANVICGKKKHGWCIRLLLRTYCLISDSNHEMNRWVQSVCSAVPRLQRSAPSGALPATSGSGCDDDCVKAELLASDDSSEWDDDSDYQYIK